MAGFARLGGAEPGHRSKRSAVMEAFLGGGNLGLILQSGSARKLLRFSPTDALPSARAARQAAPGASPGSAAAHSARGRSGVRLRGCPRLHRMPYTTPISRPLRNPHPCCRGVMPRDAIFRCLTIGRKTSASTDRVHTEGREASADVQPGREGCRLGLCLRYCTNRPSYGGVQGHDDPGTDAAVFDEHPSNPGRSREFNGQDRERHHRDGRRR